MKASGAGISISLPAQVSVEPLNVTPEVASVASWGCPHRQSTRSMACCSAWEARPVGNSIWGVPSVWLEDAVGLLSEGRYEWSFNSEGDEGYLDVYTSDGVYGLPVTQNKLNGDVLELLILAAPPRNRSLPLTS